MKKNFDAMPDWIVSFAGSSVCGKGKQVNTVSKGLIGEPLSIPRIDYQNCIFVQPGVFVIMSQNKRHCYKLLSPFEKLATELEMGVSLKALSLECFGISCLPECRDELRTAYLDYIESLGDERRAREAAALKSLDFDLSAVLDGNN